MTHLRKMMLEELQRRNYAETTIEAYIRAVEDFSRYFHCSPGSLKPSTHSGISSGAVPETKVLAEHSDTTPGGTALFLRQDTQEGLEHYGNALPEEGLSPADDPQPGRSGAARPSLEVADLVRAAGEAFIQRSHRWITWKHVKVLLAIARCRTAALGGHLDECTRCGHRAISYNSCQNRHCPKCQAGARNRWLTARQKELLPTHYVHVVFTLPRELAPLTLQNKKIIYDLLFRSSAETLLAVARDPKHLGAGIGFFSVLHTWTQRLDHQLSLAPA